MSEQKPKKDLRARLGRTISPQTPGAPPIAAPGGVIAPPTAPVAAPPAASAPVASPVVQSSPGDVAAPVAAPPVAARPVAPPVMAPPAAAKAPFSNDIAPPPFARPAPEPVKAKPSQRPDPFAAAAAAPQEVRIAVDAKPVDDAEVGRRQGGRVFLVLAASLVVGCALGAGFGAVNSRNRLYNTTVRDGHAIYTAVDTASRGVLEAQQHIEALAVAAGGGPSGHPTVSYTDLDALNGQPVPLQAAAFAGRNYNAFQPGTVDDLFTYYANIQELWRQFHDLSVIASGPTQRPSIDEFAAVAVCPTSLGQDQAAARAAIQAAADATATAAAAQYVAALSTGPDGTVRGALRFAEPELGADGNPTGHILTRAAPGAASTPIELWTAETAIPATATHAIVINGGNSAGVLSERLGSFRSYVQALQETRTLMTSTIEIQGRLTTALGDIARLEEVAAF